MLAQLPAALTSLKVIVAPPQASLAVGAVNDGVEGHSIVVLLPCPPIVGGVVSTTVIVCDTADVLPQLSVAVQVLVTL